MIPSTEAILNVAPLANVKLPDPEMIEVGCAISDVPDATVIVPEIVDVTAFAKVILPVEPVLFIEKFPVRLKPLAVD